MTEELSARVAEIEKAVAVGDYRAAHVDKALSEIKEGIEKLSARIESLKETKDQNSGMFRLINIAAAAVVAGVVSVLFGRLS